MNKFAQVLLSFCFALFISSALSEQGVIDRSRGDLLPEPVRG